MESKRAQKKVLKQERYAAKKAEKKAELKEQKKREAERKRAEWEGKLAAAATAEEREQLIESRRLLRKDRMEERTLQKRLKLERLTNADSLSLVIDLQFHHLMTPSELSSLVQQVMYCYAVNARSASPARLCLAPCQGEMQRLLHAQLPGFHNWIIDKHDRPYIDAFEDRKHHLVYLTADAEATIDVLHPDHIYIIGGLVDRNRWKGLTFKKAQEQGIQTAKLPIRTYLNMSTSQVLTVNQVVEILLKYLESRDWKASFLQVIPQRKRCEAESQVCDNDVEREQVTEDTDEQGSALRVEVSEVSSDPIKTES